jgi:hypothetical protein
MCVSTHQRKSSSVLCQNCVTYPPETLMKSVSYEDVPKQIAVAEVVDRKVCWKDLVCVSTRGGSQFPSVLLHPPPLAPDFIASYGEMSRRSGVAAEDDNHSDICPFEWNQ